MRTTLPSPLADQSSRRQIWIFTALAFFLCGCGGQRYQRRLQETIDYFEYKDRINSELGKEWSEQGITLRPPRQFELIPPPAASESDEGDGATVPMNAFEDPRQPHYLGVELPGLVAAWEAEVETASGDDESPGLAYLYVLSNADRYLQKDDEFGSGAEPQSFLNDVERHICGPLGVYLPAGNDGTGRETNHRYQETVPSGLPNSKYRPPHQFTAVKITPAIQVTDMPVALQLYEWEGRYIQVAILMVYPTDVSPREQLQERLLLALETFAVSDQRPRSSSSPSKSSGGGGRKRPAF